MTGNAIILLVIGAYGAIMFAFGYLCAWADSE